MNSLSIDSNPFSVPVLNIYNCEKFMGIKFTFFLRFCVVGSEISDLASAIQDLRFGIGDPRPGIKDPEWKRIRIRDKHPGSATLHSDKFHLNHPMIICMNVNISLTIKDKLFQK